MSGWIPTPAAGWPGIVEMFREGLEWTEEAVVTDLRYWVDKRGGELEARGNKSPTAAELVAGVPGRPTLVKRWCWSDHYVKKILKNTALWWDAKRWGVAPTAADRQGAEVESPADHQPITSRSPADHQPHNGATPILEQKSPAVHQPITSQSPAHHHTRGDHPHPHPHPSTTGETGRPALVLLPDPVTPDPSAPKAKMPPQKPTSNGIPEWAKHRRAEPQVVLHCVVRMLEEIRQRTINPERANTDAKHILELWRCVGGSLEELVPEVELLAWWAREGDTAENDIRGRRPDGSVWGKDRSRDVSTLCDPKKFVDRVEEARRCREAQQSRRAPRQQYRTEAEPAFVITPPPSRRNA